MVSIAVYSVGFVHSVPFKVRFSEETLQHMETTIAASYDWFVFIKHQLCFYNIIINEHIDSFFPLTEHGSMDDAATTAVIPFLCFSSALHQKNAVSLLFSRVIDLR